MTDAKESGAQGSSGAARAGAAPLPALAEPLADPGGETFWGVAFRRSRYVIAIVLAALFFSTIGWRLAAPPSEMGGVSLLAWSNHGLWEGVVLVLMLGVATAVCSVLVHPDSPHMGLYCALLGMAAVSVRGGTIHMLLYDAQQAGRMVPTGRSLALECVFWAFALAAAELFTRLLHEWFFANTEWITRGRPEAGEELLAKSKGGEAVGLSGTVSGFLGTQRVRGWLVVPCALIGSAAVALLLLSILMQSEDKGQVFLACFVSFLGSTIAAYLAFPRAPLMALLMAVPAAAIAGYLYGCRVSSIYPGHAGFFAMRALPVDYVVMGAPAVILGYYWAMQWSLHSSLDEE